MKPMHVNVDPPIKDKMAPNLGNVRAVKRIEAITAVLNEIRFQPKPVVGRWEMVIL